MFVTVNSGTRRVSVLAATRDEKRDVGRFLKRTLFPSNGAYFKAKRRGDRALAGAL